MRMTEIHKSLVCVAFSACSLLPSSAQDTLTFKNGNKVAALVNEILPTEIRYKRFDNPDGPLYTVLKDEVVRVKYGNGTSEEFASEALRSDGHSLSTSSAPLPENRSFKGIVARGNWVYIEARSPASVDGAAYLIEAIQDWKYWKVVPNSKDADMIIELKVDSDEGLEKSAFVEVKDRENRLLSKSVSYRSGTDGYNGYNAYRGIATKLVNEYFKKEFH